jgi:uncharacterized repeat protein (TIGR01451 family)
VYLFITAPARPLDGQSADYAVIAEAYQPGNLGALNPPLRSAAQAGADLAVDKNINPLAGNVVLADASGNGGDADRDGRYAVIARDGNNNTVGFRVRSAAVSVTKSFTVTDQYGGNRPMTGATIRYTIAVAAAGSGTAMNVVITDPVPPNTVYVPGTLRLNNAALTDSAGDDAGDVGATLPGTVTVRLGDLAGASQAQTIAFDVTIQ